MKFVRNKVIDVTITGYSVYSHVKEILNYSWKLREIRCNFLCVYKFSHGEFNSKIINLRTPVSKGYFPVSVIFRYSSLSSDTQIIHQYLQPLSSRGHSTTNSIHLLVVVITEATTWHI